MNHRTYLLFTIIFSLALSALPAQDSPDQSDASESAETISAISRENAAVLAMTLDDYPVTPGDVYTLSYRVGTDAISTDVIVEHGYTLNLGPFGRFDAQDRTFIEVQEEITNRIVNLYPRSTPRVMVRSLGVFQVTVTGEVGRAGLVRVNGLQRLEGIVSGRATDGASLRNVSVTNRRGTTRRYDLFAFTRDGEVAQNPYVRPGDTIRVSRAERIVRIGGEVRRPGRYQLQRGERLRELIERYADGRTRGAGAITVRRYRPDGRYQIIYVDYDRNPRFALQDGDVVDVIPAYRNAAVVIVSGALYGEPHNGVTPLEIPESPILMAVPFMEGLTVAGALRQLGGPTPYANHEAASVVREGGDVLSFDAREVWNGDGREIRLQPGDRVEIPFGTSGFGRSFGGPWGGN